MQASGTSDHSRVFGLDAVRAAAILSVLCSHSWPSQKGDIPNTLGIIGVEAFFVLSGFLIGGILLRMAETSRFQTWGNLFGFWKRRWYRTLPNYYLFLAFHIIFLAWVLGHPDKVFSTFKSYFLFLQNFAWDPPHPFRESWSLAVEEWFYLLFALVLWVGLKITRGAWKTWGVVIGIFLVLPQLVKLVSILHLTYVNEIIPDSTLRAFWEYVLHKPVIARLDAPLYGVALAYIAARHPLLWQRLVRYWWWALPGLGLILCSLVEDWPLSRGNLFDGMLIWPLMSCTMALLVCRCSLVFDREGWLADGVRFISRISYALYLTQGVAVVCMGFFGSRSFLYLPEYSWGWTLAIWVFSITSAWAVYRWYEKPIMDLRDRSSPKIIPDLGTPNLS